MFTAYSSLFLAMAIVGSSVVAGAIMIRELPVYFASLVRFALAVALLMPVLVLREGGFPRLSIRTWCVFCAQGLCGSFLFTVFLLYGLRLTDPSSAGIITSTTPACMAAVGWIFLRERPGPRIAWGVLLSVAGVMLLNLAGADNGRASVAGNLLVVGAVVTESMFLLLRKWVREPVSPLAASTVVSLFGLLWFLPVGLWEATTLNMGTISAQSWWAVAYYGVVVTVLAYLFWFTGIVAVPAPVAGLFTGVMPVSAVICSALVLGQRPGWPHVTGCVLVLASLALLTDLPALVRRREKTDIAAANQGAGSPPNSGASSTVSQSE